MFGGKIRKKSNALIGCVVFTSILLLNSLAFADDVPSFSDRDLEKYRTGSSFEIPNRNLDIEIPLPKSSYSKKRPYADITAILYMTDW